MNDSSSISFFARILLHKHPYNMQIFPKIIRSDGEGDYPALNDVEFTIDEKRLLALQKILSSDI